MSKTLLQKLYDGEIYPAEQIVPRDPEYRETSRKISDEKEYFQEILTENDRQRFDKLMDSRYETESMDSYESFVYGFRLGVGLMVETLPGAAEYSRE